MPDSINGVSGGQSSTAGTETGTSEAERAAKFEEAIFGQLSLTLVFDGNSEEQRMRSEARERQQEDETIS